MFVGLEALDAEDKVDDCDAGAENDRSSGGSVRR
jgi:hypothetical protein